MKLIVVPERCREQVEALVGEVLVSRHLGGTERLTLMVMRHLSPPGWSVRGSGLDDPVLEASYADIVQNALQSAMP